MKQYIGPIIGFALIALFIANMVYIHHALQVIRAQNEPGVHHDWKALLDAAQK